MGLSSKPGSYPSFSAEKDTCCVNTTTYEKFLPPPNISNISQAMRRSQMLQNGRNGTTRIGMSYLGQTVQQNITPPINRMK